MPQRLGHKDEYHGQPEEPQPGSAARAQAAPSPKVNAGLGRELEHNGDLLDVAEVRGADLETPHHIASQPLNFAVKFNVGKAEDELENLRRKGSRLPQACVYCLS